MFPPFPLVSVVTATWGRPESLRQCIYDVAKQNYHNIEHIIVTDGYDPKLNWLLKDEGYYPDNPFRRLVWLGRNWTSFSHDDSVGSVPRMVGSYLAGGEFIAYLDDDNRWTPDHIERLVHTLVEHPEVDVAGSEWIDEETNRIHGRPDTHWFEQLDASSFLHRAELLRKSSWQMDGYNCDRKLVMRWCGENGGTWYLIHGVTMIMPRHRFGSPD